MRYFFNVKWVNGGPIYKWMATYHHIRFYIKGYVSDWYDLLWLIYIEVITDTV